jgi:hypothetical protein
MHTDEDEISINRELNYWDILPSSFIIRLRAKKSLRLYANKSLQH